MNEYNDAKVKAKVGINFKDKFIVLHFILFYLLSIGFVAFSFASNKMDS
jgi:nitrate reductase NapE component